MIDNLFRPTHLLFVLGVAVLFFGPRKLPELGKGFGDALRGFTKGIKGEAESHVAPDKEAPRKPTF